jgi:hypothetical protein
MTASVKPTHPPRPLLWLAVALALVLAQGLGLVHRVLHAPQGGPAISRSVGEPAPGPAQALPGARANVAVALPSLLARLFADHEPSGCESYDQLSHADLLWGEPVATCMLASSGAVSAPHAAWQLAAQAAGYLARGPPPPG